MKNALGPEKSSQLFQTIHNYKKTDNYEHLMTAVLSLFTKSDKDLHLLVSKFFERSALHLHSSKFFVVVFTSHTFDSFFFSGFGVFIRPHHKKQYKQMLDSIINQSVSATDVPAVIEDRQRHGKRQSLLFCI